MTTRIATMPSALPIIRKIVFILLIVAIAIAAIFLLGTEQGREILSNPHHHGRHVREWVTLHPLISPMIFIAAFIVLGMLLFPVWWLYVMAGYGFGLVMGIGWSMIAATLAAVATAAMSRFLMGEWFHQRVESHIAKLQNIDERLGHNGLLVVSMVRLAHFIPFGAANLIFGITKVSLMDVALGSFIGGMPTVAILVTTGADREMLKDARYWGAMVLVNLILLGGIALRYLKPQWFRSIGVE